MQRPRIYSKRRVAPRRPRGSEGRRPKSTARTMVMFLVAAINITLTIFLVKRALEGSGSKTPAEIELKKEPVKVAVMNGCGVPGIAQQVSTYLQDNKFASRHENWQNFDVQRTVVLDRVSAKKEKGRQVAAVLGLGGDDVIVQLDPSAGCDVTVVLGRDYLRLTPFRR